MHFVVWAALHSPIPCDRRGTQPRIPNAHGMAELFAYLTELEAHLGDLIRNQGGYVYLILSVTIFLETGVVILPFLPGDTLLFAVGTYAGKGDLNPWLLFSVLGVAAVIGDCAGYGLGCWFRDHVAQGKRIALINQRHLDTTRRFYEKHGAKAIMTARFVPIVRALAPFAAGLARMSFVKLLKYSILGSIAWVGLFVWLGFFFGQIPLVQKYFPIVAVGIVGLTVIVIIKEILTTLFAKPSPTTSGIASPATDKPSAPISGSADSPI